MSSDPPRPQDPKEVHPRTSKDPVLSARHQTVHRGGERYTTHTPSTSNGGALLGLTVPTRKHHHAPTSRCDRPVDHFTQDGRNQTLSRPLTNPETFREPPRPRRTSSRGTSYAKPRIHRKTPEPCQKDTKQSTDERKGQEWGDHWNWNWNEE